MFASNTNFDLDLKMAKDVKMFAKANLRDLSSDEDESDMASQNSLTKLTRNKSKNIQKVSGLISSQSLFKILNNEDKEGGDEKNNHLKSQPGIGSNGSITITDESIKFCDTPDIQNNSSIVIGS